MILDEPVQMSKAGNIKEIPKIQVKKTDELVYGYPTKGDSMQYLKLLKSIGIPDECIKVESDSRLHSIISGKYDVAIIMRKSIPEWVWTAEKAILTALGYAYTYLDGDDFSFGQKPYPENSGYMICPAYCKDELVNKMRFYVNNI
jgi:3'-phosphoadenosine 5'-phosphosulfate (PAPS) 3'-phosphatase